MYKLITIAIINVCCLQILCSQAVLVSDAITLEPLPAVLISTRALSFTGLTDASGRVDLPRFKDTDSLVFQRISYKTLTLSYRQLRQQEFRVFLREDPLTLSGITVTASRWQQDKRELPLRISTIRARDILLQQPQTAADMLGISGEVFIQKSQLGGGSPMIRGFAANRVLLSVDGIRMNSAIFRSGNVHNVISLDPFIIENTEVAFGPGSTMYGSDAIGGVMNFSTRQPVFASNNRPRHTDIRAAFRFASANTEKTAHLSLNLGWKKIALLSSASFNDFNHLRMGKHGPTEYLRPSYMIRIHDRDSLLINPNPRLQIPTGYHHLHLMQKIRYAPNEKTDLQYSLLFSQTGDLPRYDRLLRPRGDGLRSAEWYYGPQQWMMATLSATFKSESPLFQQASIKAAHQFFGESRIERHVNNLIRQSRLEQVNVRSLNADFTKTWQQNRYRLFYGTELMVNKVRANGNDTHIDTGNSIPAAPRYPDGARWMSAAIYASGVAKLLPFLSIQSGLRYNIIRLKADFDPILYQLPFNQISINTAALTGSIGLILNPGPLWQLYVNTATGFRAPNIDDASKIFDSSPGFVVVPNPGLQPEFARSSEAGFSKTFGNILKLDISAYLTHLDQAMVRRNFSLNGQDSILYSQEMSRIQAIQNAAFANVWGIQTAAELSLSADLSLLIRYNWQQGIEELEDGSTAPLRHAAPAFGMTRLSYRKKQWHAEAYLIFNSRVSHEALAPEEQGKEYLYASDERGLPFAPAWYTLNLKSLYRMGNFTLSAGIENITNLRYRPYASGITAPGRNLIVSVRYSLSS
jgi:hemoglobin/transferrin/lactoferrin receptor protein